MIEVRAEERMLAGEESFAAWQENPKYIEAYNSLEDEFSIVAAMIEGARHAEAR
jgi:hypothetical protein